MTEIEEQHCAEALHRIGAAFESIARDLKCLRAVALACAEEGARSPVSADAAMCKVIVNAIKISPK